MATKPTESIADFLLWSGTFLDRALAAQDLREELGRIGVGEAVLREIQTRQRETVRLDMEVERERNEQREASAQIEDAFAAAKKPYMRAVELGRALFQRDGERTRRFELNRPRLLSRSGWLRQARGFFHMLLGDESAVAQMEAHGLSRAELEQSAALLERAQQAISARDTEAGEVREALRRRDEAIDDLDERLDRTVAIIRAMWPDRPDLLTRLGLD